MPAARVELKLKEPNEFYKIRKDSLKSKSNALEEHVLQLSTKTQDLAQEPREHQVMFKGKDTCKI